jgi:hypothetical protein
VDAESFAVLIRTKSTMTTEHRLPVAAADAVAYIKRASAIRAGITDSPAFHPTTQENLISLLSEAFARSASGKGRKSMMEEVWDLIREIGNAYGSLWRLFLHNFWKIMIDVLVVVLLSLMIVLPFIRKIADDEQGDPH